MIRKLRILLLAGAAALAPGGTMAIEEPAYRLVQRDGDFEVRDYPSYLVAEVLHPGPRKEADRDTFNILFGYISGNNEGERRIEMTAPVTALRTPAKIEMTAPVTRSPAEGGYLVQFVLPARYTLDTAPRPTDPRVRIREIPAERVAVLRYAGRWTESNYEKYLAALREAVAAAGLETYGPPVLSRYNAPFVPPFLRRNEIWLRVAR